MQKTNNLHRHFGQACYVTERIDCHVRSEWAQYCWIKFKTLSRLDRKDRSFVYKARLLEMPRGYFYHLCSCIPGFVAFSTNHYEWHHRMCALMEIFAIPTHHKIKTLLEQRSLSCGKQNNAISRAQRPKSYCCTRHSSAFTIFQFFIGGGKKKQVLLTHSSCTVCVCVCV